jgi:glycosyltransferase involved in cell wall biosynthesis
MKISATIITFNEERTIARVIESLRCCDEILVLDSGSTDRTVDIATKFGARVVEASWHGFAAQKNIAAELAVNDWILSLDADESLSEALEAEIWQIKKAGPQFDGYTMPRLAQYLGRWILHSGWYPDRKVRLFDRRKARWVGEYVHESVVVEGRVGHLESNILHFTCSSLSEHLKSMDRYTTLAAEEIVASKRSVTLVDLLINPPWTFFRTYFLKFGFLDGNEGLTIAFMAALYNYVKYAKASYMKPGRDV